VAEDGVSVRDNRDSIISESHQVSKTAVYQENFTVKCDKNIVRTDIAMGYKGRRGVLVKIFNSFTDTAYYVKDKRKRKILFAA
jgi:hypothetical protein